jgi:putative nucleotidyltransferase with HDIG domain
VAHDITGLKTTEARVQQQVEYLSALRDIDFAVSASLDLRVSLSAVLSHATRELGADAACILLHNAVMKTLDYAGGSGFRSDTLKHTHLPLGQGYAGRAGLEKRLVTVSGIGSRQTDLLRSPDFKAEGFETYFAVALITKGNLVGVLEVFFRRPFIGDPAWLDFLNTLAGQAAVGIDNIQLFDELQRSNANLSMAYEATIEGWSRALDLRDRETEGHTQRVAEMAIALARAAGVPEAQLQDVRRGALLHDIGKMGVPDSILLKPGPLTEDEWAIMRQHPALAQSMLAPIRYLHGALDIPWCHHEKWDGTGYPRGLKGDQIPLAARVFALADVFDALTSDRPYRAAWTEQRALEYIRENAGSYFDPALTKLFLELSAQRERP